MLGNLVEQPERKVSKSATELKTGNLLFCEDKLVTVYGRVIAFGVI